MSSSRPLEERTAQFAARIIKVCEAMPPDRLQSSHIVDQLFRSGTSVAANYAEAEEAESRPDFIHKLKVAMKELSEARCWLRIIEAGGYLPAEKLMPLMEESVELARMIGSSISTARSQYGDSNLTKRKPKGDNTRHSAGEAAVAKREAPKCPICGGEMTRRSSKDGKLFWGCRRYPDCKGSRNI